MTNAADLRAQVTGFDRNGDLVRDRGADIEDVRNGKVKLVSTEEKANANVTSESILGKAHRAVHEQRGPLYGKPLDNHTTTAQLFNAYLRRRHGWNLELDAEDVCFLNILQKISREAHRPTDDGLVDIAGYAHNLELVRDERVRRSTRHSF